jgi:hypothetical protein
MTAIVAIQALMMAIGELNCMCIPCILTVLANETRVDPGARDGPFGARHGIFLLAPIMICLLIREAFATATIKNSAQSGKEALWYPLSALPEILAVVLFTAPGLVPSKAELVERTERPTSGTPLERV